MRRQRIYWLMCLTVVLNCTMLSAQELMHAIQKADSVSAPDSTVNYTVGKIAISGNHKTKSFIILREIPFSEGEDYSLKDLVGKFEDARRQLMNTSLFHSAVVAVKEFEGFKVNILIEVKERWYLFPAPFFKPVDRNLNQWIVEQKAKLNRVNFGLRLHYYNITGVNDKLSGIVGVGYTKQFSLKYDRLYFDKKLKWGFTIGFSTGKNKEVNYNTINDKQVFIKDDNTFLGNFTNAFALLTYRRKIKTRHSFGLAYSSSKIGDTVLSLNPSYFKTGIQKISYPELFYNLSYFDVDFIPYPTKGYTAQFTFTKKGFSDAINLWQFVIKGSGSWHMGAKSFFNINLFTTVKLPSGQSYFNRQLLGYGDAYMQGYEYYVIDGVAGGFLKAGYHHDLFNFNIRIPPVKKGKEAQHIPFRIVGKLYGNTGYVHNPQPGDNGLSNKMLYSGGFGIDIVTFYDLTLKLEYSFNQLGENGLFLHRKSIF